MMLAFGHGQLSRVTSVEAFDLYSPEIDVDPFPYYAVLREKYPCYWSESGKLWILSRYDDIDAGGPRLGDVLLGARQPDRRTARPRRRHARHHRSAAPRPPARAQPGRVRPQEHRAPGRADDRDRRSRARPICAEQEPSNSSTTSPARSRSDCCSAPWACPSAITPTSGARSSSRSRPTKRSKAARPSTSRPSRS